MARLSEKTGDYSNTGSIIDRQQIIAVGGETHFDLLFIEGSEEVYLNGARLLKGSDRSYTTSDTQIILNLALAEDDELLLIGRASTNEIPYTKAVGESVVLDDGQTEVWFTAIETDGIELHVSGPLVDRGRLTSPHDYELRVNSNTGVDLKHTFPAGTILEGVQGGRLAWVDADNLSVNDGIKSKSLSARFRDTQESKEFFIETNGVQLQTLQVGLELKKWKIDSSTGIPLEDPEGTYPFLQLERGYWVPQFPESLLTYQVVSWSVEGDTLTIQAADLDSGTLFELEYGRRIIEESLLAGNAVDACNSSIFRFEEQELPIGTYVLPLGIETEPTTITTVDALSVKYSNVHPWPKNITTGTLNIPTGYIAIELSYELEAAAPFVIMFAKEYGSDEGLDTSQYFAVGREIEAGIYRVSGTAKWVEKYSSPTNVNIQKHPITGQPDIEIKLTGSLTVNSI